MRKTFDRDYDLLKESPPSVKLPYGHELGRLRAVLKDVPLEAVHVFNDDPHPGRTGTALCGKRGEVADILDYLFSAATYPFCRKCQEAAAQQLTTTPQGAREDKTMAAPATATATATTPEDRACEACPCPSPSLTRWRCPDCDVSWRRDLGGWFALDMECGCGARAHSDWTWIEWYSDTECGTCHSERTDRT